MCTNTYTHTHTHMDGDKQTFRDVVMLLEVGLSNKHLGEVNVHGNNADVAGATAKPCWRVRRIL